MTPMAHAGIWYEGRYEQWDAYVDKLAEHSRADRNKTQDRMHQQQDAAERRYRQRMQEDFE